MEKKAIFVAILSIAICSVTIGLVSPTTIVLLERNQTPIWITGSVTTLGYASIFLFSLLTGKLIDRYGIKKILTIGFTLAILGTAGYLFWRSYLILFLARAVYGLGITLAFVSTEIMINYFSHDGNRGFNMNIYVIAFQAGLAIGTLLVWTVEINESLPFIIGVFITLTALGVQMFFFRSMNIDLPKKEEGDKYTLKLMPAIAIAAALVYGYLESSSTVVIPLYSLRNNFFASDVYYSVSSFVGGSIFILLFIGKLSDRVSKYKLLVVISCMLVFLYLALILVNTSLTNIIIFFFIGGLIPAFYTVGLTYVAEKTEMKFISRANSYFAMLFGLGTLMGPALGSFFIEYNHRYADWIFSAGLCIIFIIFYSGNSFKKSI